MKRSKRKSEIYAVSARLFRQKGYVASSMREIAEAVGLEPSSLYSHIKSKEEILIDICFDCAQLFTEGMHAIENRPISTLSKIEALVDLHMDIAYNHPSSVTVFNDEWRHLPETHHAKFLQIRKQYEDQFKALLAQGITDGVFEKMSTTTAFNVIINSVKWLHFFSKRYSKEEFFAKREEIKKFIRKGLQAK